MPTRRAVFRRTALATGGAAMLAGCGGSGDEGGGIPGFDPEGRTLTVAVPTDEIPKDVNLNPFALTPRGREIREPFQQLMLPTVAPTGVYLSSGHTWTVDGEAVQVPTAVSSFEVDTDGVTTTFDDRLTYWNGDSLDARAVSLRDRVEWFAFGSGEEFPGDLVSATEYRWSMPDAESWADFKRAPSPGGVPLPPTFYEPWAEKLESATTTDKRDEITADLSGTQVDLDTYVSEGYGSGAYRIESTDAISREGLGARRRDDHPGDIAVPNLVVRTPRSDRATTLVENGSLGVGTGVIADDGGDYQRNAVSEDVEQLSRYPSPVQGGNQLLFNWESDHLRRLWVRRALAAALPGHRVVENIYGKGGRALDQYSGMLSDVASARLGSDFVDSLYQYPVEGDGETASEWMREAGYALDDGQWYDPDGAPLSLTLVVAGAARSDSDSVETAFSEFGVDVQTETRQLQPTNQFEPAITEGDFDLALGFSPSGLSPVEYYAASADVFGPFPSGPPIYAAGNPLGDCDHGTNWFSPPETVTLPESPGSLRVDGASYEDGGTTYRHDGGVDVSVCDAIERLSDPETGSAERLEAARQCARWYHYALPTVVFAQTRVGTFGNTAEFAFPAEDDALRTARTENWSPMQYHVQAGTVR